MQDTAQEAWAPKLIEKSEQILQEFLERERKKTSNPTLVHVEFQRHELDEALRKEYPAVPTGALTGAINRILTVNPKIRRLKRGHYNYLEIGEQVVSTSSVIETLERTIDELESQVQGFVVTPGLSLDLKDLRMFWAIQTAVDELEATIDRIKKVESKPTVD